MAGTNSLGRLTLDLVLKAGAFTAGMTAAERQANKSLSAIEKRAYKFGQNLGAALKAGAVLATAALGAVAVAVGQAIDRADEMRDLSIRTGIATEKLSEYGYAAKQTGTDIDGLSRGLKILSKNAAEAADAGSGKGKLFEALGINVKDAAGNLKQLDVLLPEVADKFKGLEDGTTKAALAQELFGKSGLDLIEFLNQGSAGLQEAGDKAKSLGIIISGETAAAADEFNDKLGDLRAIAEGFALQLAAELLPRLIELADKFNESAQEGELLGTTVKDVGSLFDIFAGQIKKSDEVGNSFRLMMTQVNGTLTVLKSSLGDLLDMDFSSFFKKLAEAQKRSTAAVLAGFGVQPASTPNPNARAGSGRRGGGPMNMTPGVSAEDSAAALRDYFANTGGGNKGKKPSGGKSDAEKEADKLKAAYDRMNESLTEQIGTFGLVGEAAKVRYQIENEDLSKLDAATRKLVEAKQAEALANAEKLDQMNLMKELESAAAKTADEEYKRITDGIKATDEFIDQLKFELELRGMTNLVMEKAIALRHLDANATDEQRASVAALTEELIRASENQAFLDDFKDGLSDMFVDFVSGAKSAKEAFGDFADELFKRALQFVSDKAIDAMFDAFNGDGKIAGKDSSGAGFWANLFGAFAGAFGGGKAAGGAVSPWSMYEVNERGMEGLTVNGRDYLMTGSQSGVVTPNHRMGGGGVTQTNKFYLAAPTSQRTQEQFAQRSAFELAQAQRRNG